MSDDTQQVATADLKLVLRNTDTASRNAQAALEATERLVSDIGPRFDAIEARLTGIEQRLASVTTSVDTMARVQHRTEQSIAESNAEIKQMLSDILARLPS